MSIQDTVEQIIKESLARFHLAVFCGGMVFLLLSTFDFTHGFIIRPDPIWPMFIIGVVLIILSIFLYRMDRFVNNGKNHSGSILDIRKPDTVIKAFDVMNESQKDIMRFMYKMHRREMPIDDLYKGFSKVWPGEIAREKEMLYRVKDIVHIGLLKIRSLGEKQTLAILPEKIESILESSDPPRLVS